MLSGTITFVADITGHGLVTDAFALATQSPDVPRIELDFADGYTITANVHVHRLPTREAATACATRALARIFDRLAFDHDIVIQPARDTGYALEEIDDPGGPNVAMGNVLMFVQGLEVAKQVQSEALRDKLEEPLRAGERHYPLLRHAAQSGSQVEEFTHLYTILLTLYDDEQVDVDAFIVAEQPGIPQSAQPPTRRRPRPGRMETIFTRLRNELAHRRAGVDMANTKAEAAAQVSALRQLVKRAIELHP